jgi:flagellar motor protein MotB
MFFLVLLSLAQVSEERFAIVQQGVEKALTGEVKTRPPGRRSTATPKSSSDGPKSAPEVSRKAQTQAQTQVQAQAKSREADPSAAFADVLRRLDSRLVKALGAQTLAEDDAALVVIPVARLFRPRAVTLVPEDARLFHALVSGLVAVTPEGRRLSIEVHTTRASGRFPWGTTATRAGALAEVARTAAPLGWTIEAAGLGASDAQSRRIELRVQVPRVREGGGKK